MVVTLGLQIQFHLQLQHLRLLQFLLLMQQLLGRLYILQQLQQQDKVFTRLLMVVQLGLNKLVRHLLQVRL